MGYQTIKKLLLKTGIDEIGAEMFSAVLTMFLWTFIGVRLSQGIYYANHENRCIVESYADVIIAPFYAVGCNLGKKRWKYKLN